MRDPVLPNVVVLMPTSKALLNVQLSCAAHGKPSIPARGIARSETVRHMVMASLVGAWT
jgi:hypothetical protein